MLLCDECGALMETCCDGIIRCLECEDCPACSDGPGPGEDYDPGKFRDFPPEDADYEDDEANPVPT
jgi:hypothetical protein